MVSNSATLTIIWPDVPFEIVTQPESQTVSVGTEVEFVVEATGEDLSYQWQYSNNGGKYWYTYGGKKMICSHQRCTILTKQSYSIILKVKKHPGQNWFLVMY